MPVYPPLGNEDVVKRLNSHWNPSGLIVRQGEVDAIAGVGDVATVHATFREVTRKSDRAGYTTTHSAVFQELHTTTPWYTGELLLEAAGGFDAQ